MKYAPIAIFTYNRLDVLQKMMKTLEECNNVSNYEVYIFNDAPNCNKLDDNNKVNIVREYLIKKSNNNVFKKMNLIFAKRHKGCARSIIDGLNMIFEKYDRVIDIEDDLLLARDFLNYINDGLEFFKDNNKIWSISAFTSPLSSLKEYKNSVFLGERATSWGFGIWKNRWESIDWEMSWYYEFKNNKDRINNFGEWGYDLPDMLMAQAEHFIDAWDVVSCYTQYLNNMMTVFPVKSKSYNIGLFGTHYDGENISQQEIDFLEHRYDFSEAEYSPEISKERKELFLTKEQFSKYDLYSDASKYKRYYLLMCRWMKNKNKNVGIELFLQYHHIHRLAIYGCGNMGKLLYDEIQKIDNVESVCYIDKNENKKDAICIRDNIPKVDAIIVTPIMEFYDIKRVLVKKTNAIIYSLWEIFI